MERLSILNKLYTIRGHVLSHENISSTYSSLARHFSLPTLSIRREKKRGKNHITNHLAIQFKKTKKRRKNHVKENAREKNSLRFLN